MSVPDGFVTPPMRDSPTNSYARTPMKTPTSGNAIFSRSGKSVAISPILSPNIGSGSFSDLFRCMGSTPGKNQPPQQCCSAPALEINTILKLSHTEDAQTPHYSDGVSETILDLFSSDRYKTEFEEIKPLGPPDGGREVGLARNVSDDSVYQVISIVKEEPDEEINIMDIPEVAALCGSESLCTPRYFAVWKDPGYVRVQTEVTDTVPTLASCVADDTCCLDYRNILVSLLDALSDAHSRGICHGNVTEGAICIMHANPPRHPTSRYKLSHWQSASFTRDPEVLKGDIISLAATIKKNSAHQRDPLVLSFLEELPNMTASEALNTAKIKFGLASQLSNLPLVP